MGHESGVLSVAGLSDGRIVSGSRDKTLRIWNTTTGKSEEVLKGHGVGVYLFRGGALRRPHRLTGLRKHIVNMVV
jgi:WD40 repeat protein